MNLHRYDLVTLALFVLAVRCGSISQAAVQARLALGAASKRIADLEQSVGAALLARHPRGVRTTPAGQALYTHAQRILMDVESLAADLADYAAGVVGEVRLRANTSALTQFLPEDLASFMALHPAIRIEMEEQNSRDVVMAVIEGRADFGIFADRTPTLGLETLPYRRDRLVLVVPRGHALAQAPSLDFADALAFEFVSLSAETSIADRLQAQAQALGRPLKLRIRVRSFDAMCRMIAVGLGLGVLPERAAEPMLAPLGLARVALRDEWAERELLIGVRDLAALPQAAQSLVQHLTAPTPR
ncbi:MAG: LysR family transcriptional regulator [Methylibium sp.]|uniref:LysR family transcriptional regulator n=1 Tax=Methylibium sp. TaxID=2067992 RepID=UPI0017BB2511|nr:LysR family transcriptional regulator [Methylibium sp.]MBA3597293.1 LysR family transcriptional regulator [Methylibium sp.]